MDKHVHVILSEEEVVSSRIREFGRRKNVNFQEGQSPRWTGPCEGLSSGLWVSSQDGGV